MKSLISIVGPTASGKSALGVELAIRLQAPIISVDSVQLYKGLDIGSGKITAEEMKGVAHYLLGEVEPTEVLSAADFGTMANRKLDVLFEQHDYVIAVGGSGFYWEAFLHGLDDMPSVPDAVRKAVRHQASAEGLVGLLEELRKGDPETFERIDKQNPVRVCRAVEILRSSGKPISFFRAGKRKQDRGFNSVVLGLEVERDELRSRISKRVDDMVANGWVEEVKGLVSQYGEDAVALGSLGYREWVNHLRGVKSFVETVELIKTKTYQFSKRQMTWFRRDPKIHWISPDDFQGAWGWIQQQTDVRS